MCTLAEAAENPQADSQGEPANNANQNPSASKLKKKSKALLPDEEEDGDEEEEEAVGVSKKDPELRRWELLQGSGLAKVSLPRT